MTTLLSDTEPSTPLRQHWMSVLAKAPSETLARHWAEEPTRPSYRMLRAPETGLVMLRGRIGGSGAPFNVGEATVTRCAVELDGAAVLGQAYVMGTDLRHAEIAAVYDALLQHGEARARILDSVITPLAAAQARKRHERASKAAATKVDFFTLVRGEDE
ncbi:alpha-D-ribose 1-methylphosphonate 5-triphosphate synthase subunit PhnG [Rhodoligotrophos appendicifer]|uniref:phosphonate C-P lyase system protein PhnG n=1 Tax=Rhodoligotrophos appendicifer TaxID=987056 RepID=UPI00117E74F7|nr:phosphonate C-P lyase system protein PhnG [Rhodoligotrophos appendicifer]